MIRHTGEVREESSQNILSLALCRCPGPDCSTEEVSIRADCLSVIKFSSQSGPGPGPGPAPSWCSRQTMSALIGPVTGLETLSCHTQYSLSWSDSRPRHQTLLRLSSVQACHRIVNKGLTPVSPVSVVSKSVWNGVKNSGDG